MGESKLAPHFPYLRNQLVPIELRAEHHLLPIVESEARSADSLQLCWPTEDDTAAFAARLATAPALVHALLTLEGDLGAGKTSLVRHLLRALGVTGRIKSPTYALVEVYDLAALHIWHCDFYRFNDAREWEEAGLRDIFTSAGLKLVEWPQKAAPWLPVADLALHLHVQPDGTRQVNLLAHSDTGVALLQQVRPEGTQ